MTLLFVTIYNSTLLQYTTTTIYIRVTAITLLPVGCWNQQQRHEQEQEQQHQPDKQQQ